MLPAIQLCFPILDPLFEPIQSLLLIADRQFHIITRLSTLFVIFDKRLNTVALGGGVGFEIRPFGFDTVVFFLTNLRLDLPNDIRDVSLGFGF